MSSRIIPIPRGAIRVQVPDTHQFTDTTCGASSLLAVCCYYGVAGAVSRAEEDKIVAVSGMNPTAGSDPEHLVRAAKAYGLVWEEQEWMSVRRLQAHLDDRKPVVVMLQACYELPSYRNEWDCGHWVVAIGYDAKRVYFEDPEIDGHRGYLSYADLADRWHDYGAHYRHVYEYGLVLSKRGATRRKVRIRTAKRIS